MIVLAVPIHAHYQIIILIAGKPQASLNSGPNSKVVGVADNYSASLMSVPGCFIRRTIIDHQHVCVRNTAPNGMDNLSDGTLLIISRNYH